MSESEVRKARMEVDESTARLERAMDQLVMKVEESVERFDSARAQVMEMREQAMNIKDRVESVAHDPEARIRELIAPTVEKVEHLITGKADAVAQQARATLERSFDETQGMIDGFIADLRRRADDVVALMESRPYASWMTVFFMGCIAGALMDQRVTRRADRGIEAPGSAPPPLPETERFPRRAA